MLRRAFARATTLLVVVPASVTAAGDEPVGAALGSFSPAGRLQDARDDHTATLLADGRVLVVGGRNGQGYLATAEVWDPMTRTFSKVGWLGEKRVGHTATRLPDGRVLVTGGGRLSTLGDGHRSGWQAWSSAVAWDPATASFEPAGSLSEARSAHTATLLPDGRVLIIGGLGPEALTSAEMWDPATELFTPAGTLAKPRYGHTATLLPDGRVLVIGGGRVTGPGGDGFEGARSAEMWDPGSMTFALAGPLVASRWRHTATLVPDGRVLVVGAWHRGPRASEVWDPETETFRPTGPTIRQRKHHTATLLPDGRVLIVGGRSASGFITSAEVWDPETGRFAAAGALKKGQRLFHTATLLRDGRVLIIGGGRKPLAVAWEPVEQVSR